MNDDFRTEQRNDPTLTIYWNRANRGSSEYRVINGLLYRQTPQNVDTENELLLMVPQKYRQQVLRLAHDSKLAGHLGYRKTYARLKTNFFFPKMLKAVKQHVRNCHNCQMVAPLQTQERQPLNPIPIMHCHAFEDITIDIMTGKLPRTKRGNQFLLTLVCNASGWITGIPLKSLKADVIADKLLEHFCSFGLPRVIRSDNMAGFQSQLLTEMRKKLNIEAQFSMPFHFQSHGRIERANRTIETMLRKFIHESPKEWDTLIHYLLFAYRDVPNMNTKVTPHELDK